MRLVCPKCVAQYEVAEQEIPEEGREVQCANCEHVWFQDRIVMFTEKRETADTPEISEEKRETEIFEDLDGVGEVTFRRHRDAAPAPEETPTVTETANLDDADSPTDNTDNILAENYDEEPEYDDDLPNEIPEGGLPLNDEVLDVLRKEAEFSNNHSDVEVPPAPDCPDSEEQATEEPIDTDLDELAAFLSSQDLDEAEPESDAVDAEPITDPPAANDTDNQAFDPLSDLEAIRNQLDSIREDTTDAQAIETDTDLVLPEDDNLSEDDFQLDIEIPDLDATISSTLTAPPAEDPEEPTPNSLPEFDLEALSETLDTSPETDEISNAIAFDDFEETRPRRAFRADLSEENLSEEIATAEPITEESSPEETFFTTPDADPEPLPEISASAIQAAAALGSMRPRSSGSPRRVRNISEPQDLIADTPPDPDTTTKDIATTLLRPIRPNKSETSERPERPAKKSSETSPASRKELLPDVEELDLTLRSEAATVQTEQEQGQTAPRSATKSFGQAFVWTLLVLAFLVTLYVMRPTIVTALPASGVVLNPYANFIDSLRLMIENLIG